MFKVIKNFYYKKFAWFLLTHLHILVNDISDEYNNLVDNDISDDYDNPINKDNIPCLILQNKSNNNSKAIDLKKLNLISM